MPQLEFGEKLNHNAFRGITELVGRSEQAQEGHDNGLESLRLGPLQVREDESTESVRPEAGFVVKTTVTSSQGTAGSKLFINLVYSDRVEAIEHDLSDASITKLMQTTELEFPVRVSQLKQDTDNAGRDCLVIDCCVHSVLYLRAMDNADLKALLIEACIESVEQSHSLRLSRSFALPRLRVKGDIESVKVRAETRLNRIQELVSDVGVYPSEPDSALIPEKIPKSVQWLHKSTGPELIIWSKDFIQHDCSQLNISINATKSFLEFEHPRFTIEPFELPHAIYSCRQAFFERSRDLLVIQLVRRSLSDTHSK